MKHIDLFEQWIPKLSNEPVPISKVGSFGQRITDTGKKKIKKQDIIVATDKTIEKIVRDEITRLGKDADLNHIDVSHVTSMYRLFKGTDFQGDVSEWDVSQVEDMCYMFDGCKNFNCDISKWNTWNVFRSYFMFDGCESFNQPIGKWDVSSVKHMAFMFSGCKNFNQDLSDWKVGKVKNMASMFENCTNFNQDLSDWEVSQVENIKDMFEKCPIKDEYKPKFNI